jgi:hypothetical protein
MKFLSKKVLLGVVLAAGAAVFTAGGASARVVCNREGDCWHTDARDNYGRHWEVHPDDWYFHQRWDQDRRRHWREWHEGRGYYENGVWVVPR